LISDFYYKLDSIGEAALQIISHAGNQNLWCFYGEMGAGKTTMIKEIARLFEVNSEVNSPTFSLVNEYSTQFGKKLFHFDFYRILSLAEVYDIGFEDYFYSGNICLIEWPEKIEEILNSESYFKISIELGENESQRKLTLSHYVDGEEINI